MMKELLHGRPDLGPDGPRQPDVGTILENLVRLDEILDEGSRRELDSLPYLELSKYMKIRRS